jgi:hypothetical protein
MLLYSAVLLLSLNNAGEIITLFVLLSIKINRINRGKVLVEVLNGK